MVKRALLLLPLLLAGCTVTQITHTEPTWTMVGTNLIRTGGGFTVTRKTGLTKHIVADLNASTTTNGISFRMQGYSGDNVTALAIAVKAAVEAGIAGATGKP